MYRHFYFNSFQNPKITVSPLVRSDIRQLHKIVLGIYRHEVCRERKIFIMNEKYIILKKACRYKDIVQCSIPKI